LGEGGKPRFFGKGPEGAPFLLALGVSEAGAAAKGDFLGREERELLDSIIVKALKLPVGGVYVMPVLRCPKPDDALPRGAEKACGNISLKEIKLARPKAVLSFGHEAARILSKETAVLDTLRRKKDRSLESGDSLAPFMMTIGLDVMLEFPELKKDAWADIKTILRVIARK
jgi:uracil-DNA glycosylase family 4